MSNGSATRSLAAITLVTTLCLCGWKLSVNNVHWVPSRMPQVSYSYPVEWNQVKYIWTPTDKEKLALTSQVERRYKARSETLEKFCSKQKLKSNSKEHPQQLIAALDGNLSVCYIQKAASTSWNRLVWRLRHKVSSIPDGVGGIRTDNLRDLKKLGFDEKKHLVTSSVSVISVRHPFARLISGWNNKLHREFIRTHGNHMLHAMPYLTQHLMSEERSPDHAITFERFLAVIIAQSKNRTRSQWIANLDSHFRPMLDLCRPCDLPYRYIVKLETAPDDVWFVLDQINVTMTSFVSQSNVTSSSWGVASPKGGLSIGENFARRTDLATQELEAAIGDYFRGIPVDMKRRLAELYSGDFRAFGYSYDFEKNLAGGIL